MEKLHPRAVWLFFVKFLFVGFFFIAAFTPLLFAFLVDKLKVDFLALDLVPLFGNSLVLAIFYIAFCYLWAVLSYRFWGYELTKNSLKIEKGVIWKKYISIPYQRIQNVDIYRGVLARILGLSDLQVQTAGYSAPGKQGMATEGRLPGLDTKVAEDLRDKLVGKVGGKSQGL